MIVKGENLIVVSLITAATLASFFLGGYHRLSPFLFLLGIVLASVVCLWFAREMGVREYVTLSAVTLVVAWFDEYVHTTSKVFEYYDALRPSPLSVFGWGLFVPGIVAVAGVLNEKFLNGVSERRIRLAPVLASLLALVLSAWLQGYISMVTWHLVLLYSLLAVLSVFYSSNHSTGWSLSLQLSAIGLGGLMEIMGGLDGMWVYRFSSPFALFIAFTWSLRVWAILFLCQLLGTRILENEPA